jgi:primosomal protein N' (replication factor Y)
MSSAGRSASAATKPQGANREFLSGPVAICIDRPVLALDRPFTYELAPEVGGLGSLVQVRFHGRLVRGWVLGPTSDVPDHMLPVVKAVSAMRFFDPQLLELYRWMSERYVSPLAAVIGRAAPPRVASEEVARADGEGGRSGASDATEGSRGREAPPEDGDPAARRLLADAYANGDHLLDALRDGGSGTHLVRTGPGEDAAIAVDCVRAALAGGRGAIVIVPEVDPLPATVAGVCEAFGDRVASFFGGDKRSRYRMWLDIGSGRYSVVVGTRPAVFAPIPNLGLVHVAREHHALHREERAPYFHAREVAVERARICGAVCVLASVMPSLDALALPRVDVEPAGRRWPAVEVVSPGFEGRATRLVKALQTARRAFLYEPVRGYGVARVCRACGETASCGACGGSLRAERGSLRCSVCEAPGRCARCGASDFGIARGGSERVEEWARGVARVPVTLLEPGDRVRPPGEREVLVGGLEALKDFGGLGLDVVGILNTDAALRRPGLASRERALSAWAEAAAWAAPQGRVIVQSSHPNDHAVQSLVAGKPDRFARTEPSRRAAAGFPVGAAVFRVVGSSGLEEAISTVPHHTLLVSALEEQTVCLVALDPTDVGRLGERLRLLAQRGIVTRVEAEPHL